IPWMPRDVPKCSFPNVICGMRMNRFCPPAAITDGILGILNPGNPLLSTTAPDPTGSVPHFTDVDFYTRVTGDSMYPKYRHGDIIACKSIDTSAFFAFYEPYAIVTRTNNQRLIKYIHPHP